MTDESREAAHSCHGEAPASPPRPGRKLKISLAVLAVVWGVSLLPALASLNTALESYFGMIWWAVLLGLLLGGLLDWFVPDGLVRRWLGGDSLGALLRAVLAGFLMSACSHGMLAIAIALYRKGAGVPSVVTFLLAAPWANFPVTVLLFSYFGWQALLIVGAAMGIALLTGLAFSLLDRLGWIEEAPEPEPGREETDWRRLREFDARASVQGVWAGALGLANMVLWWIIIGFLAAAFIQAYVPGDLFRAWMGPTFTGLLVTLAVATVIEICSEGSAPIAFEIHRQVGALGNPFVFLMAGVVTDYTEIGLLWTSIGRRTALWLPVVAVPQVLLVAWAFNRFL